MLSLYIHLFHFLLKLLKFSRIFSYKMLPAGALEKGGVGALELVAMDMKARLILV